MNRNILVGFEEEDYPNILNFKDLGNCTFKKYDRNYLISNISKYEIFIPHLFENIDNEIIELAKKLKILATPSTGSDHLDLSFLKEKNIKFISLNDDREFINEITSTAEMSWLLILACMRNLKSLFKRIETEKSWINTDIRGYELHKKTLGIIGYGRLGKMVAKYANAFGMKVIANDIDPSKYDNNVSPVNLETLLKKSDVISIHAKLNSSSQKLISFREVDHMKEGVVIVNTARGEIINPKAIVEGIDSNKIASVGLDVCTNEYQSTKLPNDLLLLKSFEDKRIIVTPHAGGSTIDAHAKVFGKISELIKLNLKI